MPGFDRRAILLGLGAGMLGTAGPGGTAGVPSSYDDDPGALYGALRYQPQHRIEVGGGRIGLVFADGAPGVERAPVMAWVRAAASAVAAYFGRFPVSDYGLLVVAEAGSRIGHATTFGDGGAATRIRVGVDADRAAFDRDWVLVHEMVHTALPDLPRRALWLQEGNATFIEPIARAMIGQLTPAEVWRESVVGMSKGNPEPNDSGMDGTRSWGRLYWGGAIFWLLAEIAIYRESMGRRSLRDALRHINRLSGGNRERWSPEQLVGAGDAATGTHSLSRLYARFSETRIETDLAILFAELGVARRSDGTITFDDRAPLAALRHRMTAR